jgi:hypothetical protein
MEAIHFTDVEKSAFRAAYAPAGTTDEQWALFLNECQRRALVPGKDCIFQLRNSKEFNKDLNKDVWVKKMIVITTIAGLRLIADRSGKYEGHGPFIFYYGDENNELRESKIPLGKIPHAVSVEGYRKDWRVPMFWTARYAAYVQTMGETKSPTTMWKTRGEEQLAKCAEAGMLRAIAPEECAGLLINEELGNDGVVDKESAGESTTAVPAFIPQPTVAPAVNQQAAPYQQPMQPPVNIPGFITAPVPDMSELSTGGMTVIGGMMGSIVHIEEPPPEAPFPNMEPLNAVTRAQTYENGIKSGELTVTDVRKAEGLPSIASVQNADALISRPELDKFLARAAKIVRDKLPKGGLKDAEASSGVKNYLLKSSGKSGFRFISATVFETLLTALEAGTPENAAAIVKAAK